MASKPKVPFALHESVTVVANFDAPFGVDVALSSDGEMAAVNSGRWGARRLLLIDLHTGVVRDGLPPAHQRYELLPVWSPDSTRWAISGGEGSPGKEKGKLTVGDREGQSRTTLTTPIFRYSTRNAQARPAPMAQWSQDATTLVQRSLTQDERNVLFDVSVSDGAVRERWLAEDHCDVTAHTISSHASNRRLYALCPNPGDLAGLLWFDDDRDEPAGVLPWVFGLRLVPTKRGVWALGHPGYCFWISETNAANVASAAASRAARLDELSKRAKAKWDVDCVRDSFRRDMNPSENYNIAYGRNGAAAGNQSPPASEGMRCFENDLFWETAFAAPIGDDDVVVTDGVGVWRWSATSSGLEQVLLADDLQKCTHRGCRIIGISAAKDLVALLWKKDAGGEKCVLSLLKVR